MIALHQKQDRQKESKTEYWCFSDSIGIIDLRVPLDFWRKRNWHPKKKKEENRKEWGAGCFFCGQSFPYWMDLLMWPSWIRNHPHPLFYFDTYWTYSDHQLYSSKSSLINRIMWIRQRMENSPHLLIPPFRIYLTKASPYTFIVVFSRGRVSTHEEFYASLTCQEIEL